jgi:hypothetical protein
LFILCSYYLRGPEREREKTFYYRL